MLSSNFEVWQRFKQLTVKAAKPGTCLACYLPCSVAYCRRLSVTQLSPLWPREAQHRSHGPENVNIKPFQQIKRLTCGPISYIVRTIRGDLCKFPILSIGQDLEGTVHFSSNAKLNWNLEAGRCISGRFDPVHVENLMLTDCGVILVFNAPTLVS